MMNQNLTVTRTKLAFVLAINLIAPLIFGQSAALVAQTPTRITGPTPTSTGTPTQIGPAAKPNKPLNKKNLPDLEITEVMTDLMRCDFYVRVVNRGGGNAGPFGVYINFKTSLAWAVGQQVTTLDLMRLAEVKGLASGDSVPVLIRPVYFNFSGNACVAKDVAMVHAVADPRYLYKVGLGQNIVGLINPRNYSPIAADVKIAESRIDESNENNNELFVNKSQFKPIP